MAKELRMLDVWKMKLDELRLQEFLLVKDGTRPDELAGIREMIEQVRDEIKKEFVQEKLAKMKKEKEEKKL